jgi:hypothetical protein
MDMKYGRSSFDSEDIPTSPLIDDGTWSRSVRRYRIVEEIVSSEESYVRDLKTLINVTNVEKAPLVLFTEHDTGLFDCSSKKRSRSQDGAKTSFSNPSTPRRVITRIANGSE